MFEELNTKQVQIGIFGGIALNGLYSIFVWNPFGISEQQSFWVEASIVGLLILGWETFGLLCVWTFVKGLRKFRHAR